MATRKLRVLSLDGGGVRGLSALYILDDLLQKVDAEIQRLHRENGIPNKSERLLPTEVFDIIVGTSTGGLITIMIVKLKMKVEDCIKAYQELAGTIFNKPSFVGSWTWGLGVPKYSGDKLKECVIKLIRDYAGEGENFTIEHPTALKDDDQLCTVVCRELETNWTKRRKPHAVFLCNDRCRPQFGANYKTCLLWEAARATSAAPTYFAALEALDKNLVDGGYGETNNPSFDVAMHYDEKQNIKITDDVQWVNIGTGSPEPGKPIVPPQKISRFFIPPFMKNARNLMRDLESIATESEGVAERMEYNARMTTIPGGGQRVRFKRFSADNGVAGIKLDDHKKISDNTLKDLTQQYLKRPEVARELELQATSLAAETFARQMRKRRERTASFLEIRQTYDLLPRPSSSSTPTTPPVNNEEARASTPRYDPNLLLSPETRNPGLAGPSLHTAESSDEGTRTPPQPATNSEEGEEQLDPAVLEADSLLPPEHDRQALGGQFIDADVDVDRIERIQPKETAPPASDQALKEIRIS